MPAVWKSVTAPISALWCLMIWPPPTAVLQFSRIAHQHFYVESMHSLKLGMIARKLVDIGGVGIEKASEAAIRKLVPALNAEELLGFVEYLEPLYIDVPPHAQQEGMRL